MVLLLVFMQLTRDLFAIAKFLFFDCYGQVGKVVVKVVESTQCRWSWTATATTDADVRWAAAVVVESTTEWPRSSGTDVVPDLSLRQRPVIVNLSLTPRLSQPVVVYTLSLTSRFRPRATVFDTSTTPRPLDATSRPVAPSATASTVITSLSQCRQHNAATEGARQYVYCV